MLLGRNKNRFLESFPKKQKQKKKLVIIIKIIVLITNDLKL